MYVEVKSKDVTYAVARMQLLVNIAKALRRNVVGNLQYDIRKLRFIRNWELNYY